MPAGNWRQSDRYEEAHAAGPRAGQNCQHTDVAAAEDRPRPQGNVMARLTAPLNRIIGTRQKQLDAIANRPSPIAYGADRTGMPEMNAVGGLAELEKQTARRWSPRKNRWAEVRQFDDKVAEYERRRAEISDRLDPLQHQLALADQTDADAVAEWIANGGKGFRPESVKPQLEQEVADLRREDAGLVRAASVELERKEEFVAAHRARLTTLAHQRVKRAHADLVERLDGLPSSREELVAAREEQLWAMTFGSEDANQMPQLSHLAGGDARVGKRLGLSSVTPVERLYEALRADAAWLTDAISAEQRKALGDHDETSSAVWTDTDQGREWQRQQAAEAGERIRRAQQPGTAWEEG
jgi:hypothetical protein